MPLGTSNPQFHGPLAEPGVSGLRPSVRHAIVALEDWRDRMQLMQQYAEIELEYFYELRKSLASGKITTDDAAHYVGRVHTIWADFEGYTDGMKLSVLRHLRDGIESGASAYGLLHHD